LFIGYGIAGNRAAAIEPIKVLIILRHGSEGVGSPACPILDGIFGRGHVGGFGP
jgi:hypothetical protein